MEFKKYDKVYIKANSTTYGGKYKGEEGTVLFIYSTPSEKKIAVSLESYDNPESKYGWFYFYPHELDYTMGAKNETKTNPFSIKDVIFNDPAVIVLWNDGSKTVVKCSENDIFDPEKGLAMAISKKALGNQGNYYETFKKYLPEEEDVDDFGLDPFVRLREAAKLTNDMKNMNEGFKSLKEQSSDSSTSTTAYDDPYSCVTCEYLCQPLGSEPCYGCTIHKSNQKPEK